MNVAYPVRYRWNGILGIGPVALLLLVSGAAYGADAGAVIGDVYQLIYGPLTMIIVALGFLAALVAWGMGHKRAGIMLLAGFMFLAVVRTSVVSANVGGNGWLQNPTGATISAGTGFPTYGNAGASPAWIPGSEYTLGYTAEWGTMGLFYCHAILTGFFGMSLIALVALLGAWRTYYMVTVKHHAGSMLGYLVTVVLVGGLCIMPVVRFNVVPANNSKNIPNSTFVIKAVAGTNTLLNSIGNGTAVNVPILPAMVIIAGYDLATKAGELINPSPPTGYAGMVYKAALCAGLADEQIQDYQEYAAQCGAAARGVNTNETHVEQQGWYNDVGTAVAFPNIVNQRVTLGRQKLAAGEVMPGQLHALSRFGDWMFIGVPLDAWTFNDDDEKSNALSYSHSLDLVSGRQTVYYIPGLPTVGDKVDPVTLMLGGYAGTAGTSRSDYSDGGYPSIRPPDARWSLDGIPLYRRPFGDWARRPGVMPRPMGRPGGQTTLRVCVMPNHGDDAAQVTVDMAASAISDPNRMASWYEVAMTPLGGKTQYHFIDYATDVRYRILQRYTDAGGHDLCSSIAGSPENRDWWGCLISGEFSGRIGSDNPGYNLALGAQDWFFDSGQINVQNLNGTKTPVTPAQYLVDKLTAPLWPNYDGGLYDGDIPMRMGTGDDLKHQDIGNSAWTHSALDVLFMAPGIYNQVSGVSHSGTSAQLDAQAGNLSIWKIFISKPGAIIQGLIALILLAIQYLTEMLWPHIQGIVLALLLGLAYPVAATVALWPGNWRYLMDWSLATLWVIAWVVPMALGYSLMHNTSLNEFASVMGASGPPFGGGIVTRMVGTALVLMAPAISSMMFSLTFSSYGSMASSIAGTAFQVVGMAAAIVGAAAGLGAGALVGALGAAGAAKASVAGEGIATATSGAGNTGAVGGGGGGMVPAGNGILQRGMAGLQTGARAGSIASRGVQAGMGVVSTLAGGGPAGQVARGAHMGVHAGEAASHVAVEAAAAGGVAASRAGARVLTAIPPATRTGTGSGIGRLANSLAGDAAPALRGTIAGGMMETLGGVGGGGFGLNSLMDLGGDGKTQATLFSRQAAAAHATYDQALRQGQPNSREAMAAVATSAAASRAAAAQAHRSGDAVGAAEHLRRSADAEVAAFLHGGGDYDRARGSVQMASQAGHEAERSSLLKGDAQGARAGQELHAETRAQQARVAFGQWERIRSSIPKDQEPNPSIQRTLEELRSEAILSSRDAMHGFDKSFAARSELGPSFGAGAGGQRQRLENLAAMTALAAQAREAQSIHQDTGGIFTAASPGPAILSDGLVETGLRQASVGGGKTARAFADASMATLASAGNPISTVASQWRNVQIAAQLEEHETVARFAGNMAQVQEAEGLPVSTVGRVAAISHELGRQVTGTSEGPLASGVRVFNDLVPPMHMIITQVNDAAPSTAVPPTDGNKR